MIIDNELLNTLLRAGDGYKTFSTSPKIEHLIDHTGRFYQNGDVIPMMDGLRALVHTAKCLHPELIHGVDLASICFQRRELESLIITLVRQMPVQRDIEDPAPPNPRKLVATEVGVALDCYKTAVEILKQAEAHRANNYPMSIDKFNELVSKSKNPDLTLTLLTDAGPQHPSWVSADGPLPPLLDLMPDALPAKKRVHITCKLTDLNRKQGVAKVEIVKFETKYSEAVLTNRIPDVELHFDSQSVQLDDLRLLYYRDASFPIFASAKCAVHSKYSRKTSLTLSEIGLPRSQLDEMHAKAKQLSFPFGEKDDN